MMGREDFPDPWVQVVLSLPIGARLGAEVAMVGGDPMDQTADPVALDRMWMWRSASRKAVTLCCGSALKLRAK